MYAWGAGKDSQLAVGSKEDQPRPVSIPFTEPIVSLACGARMNLALTSGGDLYSWGTGLMGELGLAYITKQETPAKLQKVSTKFKSIAVGYEHCLAVSEAGDIYVWGANDLGQLGTGDLKPIDRPTKLKLGHKFTAVAAGTKHSMALNEHGFVFLWGAGWAGQQGDGASASFLTPHILTEDITFKYISAGDYCSLAITNRGKVYTWGSGAHGRLGHGDVKPQLVPKVIDHLTKMNVNAVKVIAGYDHMLLLSDKGELWAWGAGANGETAQDTTVRRMVPHPVLFATPPAEPSSDPAPSQASAPETPVEDSDAQITPRRRTPPPTTAPSTPGPFIDIASGLNFSVAITQQGECYTWGNARNGVLGNGQTSGIVRVATKIDTAASFTKVYASRDHVIAFGQGEGAEVVQTPEAPPTEESAPNGNEASSST
jgi:alpha-tubulin suppressor-like RCC1 family protein